MKNPYFASRKPPTDTAAPHPIAERLAQTGMNTGNLLFFDACRRVIKHTHDTSGERGIGFDPRAVSQHHDGIVIPAANWLQPKNDSFLGSLAAKIEATKLPCTVIGLGAQSIDRGAEKKFDSGILRFL